MAFEDRAVAFRSSTCEYVNVGLFNVDEPCVFPHPFLFFFSSSTFISLPQQVIDYRVRTPLKQALFSDLAVLHAW
jgi:hypothetical protein